METPNNPVVSGSTATSSGLTGGVSIAIPGWDEPLTEEELEAIDASVEAASAGRAPNHKKRRPPEAEDSRIETPRRRLPRSSSLSPCQVNEVMRYPSMAFGGRILYSRTTVEVEKSAAELLKKINALKRLTDQVTIGFDIEWRPTFRRGAPLRKAAVMQICCNTDDCYVMHIVHSNIPQSLKLILEDRAVIKVGVGIVNDAVKVQKDYNVSVQACEDLSWLANEKLHHDQRNWSLAHLTEILVSKQLFSLIPLGYSILLVYENLIYLELSCKTWDMLPKPRNIRLGNWEALFLSREQLHYAATDAFASWHLYKVLKSLPDLETNNSEIDNKKEAATSVLL
ncbi:hypothetical protein CRG98_016836 [Punica granatum]|uniref:3'-5' exonuclease n=1 Tax=Punica granatum TaxID=22663 RepID=A0A2I0K2J1_PUNGR|nr:hypothetical protein CRG98_016836 [Punica granatum]